MATAFEVRLLGTALAVILESTDFGDKGPHWAFFPIIAAESKWTTIAVPSDTAGKLSEVILRPGGATEIAGGGAKRNHRDWAKKVVRVPAGTPDQNSQQEQYRSGALSGRVVLSWRFRRLRFAPPPANIPGASGAIGVCQQYPGRLHSKGCRHFNPFPIA
jgi:hypothetical protein